MRNIKTTLRNTRNSGMLFAAVSGFLYLTACTSDVLYDAPNENITESNVIIGNDPAAQAHRIHFFGNQGTRGIVPGASRAFTMPNFPVFPVEAPTEAEINSAIPVKRIDDWNFNVNVNTLNNNRD